MMISTTKTYKKSKDEFEAITRNTELTLKDRKSQSIAVVNDLTIQSKKIETSFVCNPNIKVEINQNIIHCFLNDSIIVNQCDVPNTPILKVASVCHNSIQV